jgi:glutamate formiminotransferase / formiminotetrahydrofolate cyclodeaminase
MAQVSMNLDNFKVTAPHEVFEAISEKAAEMNLAVAGSELVGLIPLEAMLLAADYYMEKENLFILDEKQKIRLVIERLGLSSISKFVPEKGIIEYMIEEENSEPLASLSVRGFVEILGARTAAPGGGSASALIAAMGAGLGAMVGWMTYGKRKWEDLDSTMRGLIPPLHNAMTELIPMIDADTNAFNDYMNAMGMPKNTDDEKAARTAAMQEGLKKAIMVPLKTMQLGDGCWDTMKEMAKHGNIASKSDLEVGAKSLNTGIWGAHKNVMINLPGIKDEAFIADITKQADDILARAEAMMNEVLETLNGREA